MPVVVRDGHANPCAQVAENQKRHGLTPLDLARFIRGRIDAGDSTTMVAKTLGLDLTTLAHHLALLVLPPVVDAAMKARRCSSPRTLYELGKLHAEQPERVAEPVTGTEPITRDAVAEIRDTDAQVTAAASADRPRTGRPSKAAQLLSRATGLCDKLDATLTQLGQADLNALPTDDVAALRHRMRNWPVASTRECRGDWMSAAEPIDAVQTAAAMRDRVTFALCGIRPQLQAQAAKRQMTAAALVRHAVMAMLDDSPSDAGDGKSTDGNCSTQVIKVTLRLSVAHAVVLASRARSRRFPGHVRRTTDRRHTGPVPGRQTKRAPLMF